MHWALEKGHLAITNLFGTADPTTKYQLETKFYGDHVVHSTYRRNATGKQSEIVETRWKRGIEIGSGGFAKVYVEENEAGELRAVKELIRGPKNAKYARELNALAKLIEHQHLFVQFYGWYENTSSVFIAMEYIEYGDLGKYIKTLEAKSHAKSITHQPLEGLVVLHDNKLCHRDLKPKNILVVSLEPIRVKITDFGISKSEEGTDQLKTQLGTLGYMAPEQIGVLPRNYRARKSVYTRSVDIWALGCLIHEILTTKLPFIQQGYETTTIFKTAPETPFNPTLSSTVPLSSYIQEPALSQLDMNLLVQYCEGSVGFPAGVLKECLVSDKGIEFVSKLLIADPRHRISAEDALKSSWLVDKDQEKTPRETQSTCQAPSDVKLDSIPEISSQFISHLLSIPGDWPSSGCL